MSNLPATRQASFEVNQTLVTEINGKQTTVKIAFDKEVAKKVGRWFNKLVISRKYPTNKNTLTLGHPQIKQAAINRFGRQKPTPSEVDEFLDEMFLALQQRRELALNECVMAGMISSHFIQYADARTGRPSISTDLPVTIPDDYWDDSESNAELAEDLLPALSPRKPDDLIEQRLAITTCLMNQSKAVEDALINTFRGEMNALALEQEGDDLERDEDGFQPGHVDRDRDREISVTVFHQGAGESARNDPGALPADHENAGDGGR